jgi:hypothetical protein
MVDRGKLTDVNAVKGNLLKDICEMDKIVLVMREGKIV